MEKVAIILLNWNSYQDTFECIKSLEQIKEPEFEIFLVDNHSHDDSFNILQEDKRKNKFKSNITFIQSGENLGFAGGNNIGIKVAYDRNYKYFWMLNNDTCIKPDTLSSLVNVIDSNKNIGIVGSKIYYHDTNKIWFAGGKINRWIGKVAHIGFNKIDFGQYDKIKKVDYITGCSLLFRREVIDSIGLMKEDYFLYYEETDWNLRASNHGWKIIYVPNSIVYHKVSQSSGGPKNLQPYVMYYDIRNPYVMIKRNNIFGSNFTSSLFLIYKLVKNLLKTLVSNQNKKRERCWYYLKAFSDSVTLKMGKHPNYK